MTPPGASELHTRLRAYFIAFQSFDGYVLITDDCIALFHILFYYQNDDNDTSCNQRPYRMKCWRTRQRRGRFDNFVTSSANQTRMKIARACATLLKSRSQEKSIQADKSMNYATFLSGLPLIMRFRAWRSLPSRKSFLFPWSKYLFARQRILLCRSPNCWHKMTCFFLVFDWIGASVEYRFDDIWSNCQQ